MVRERSEVVLKRRSLPFLCSRFPVGVMLALHIPVKGSPSPVTLSLIALHKALLCCEIDA